MEIERIEYGPVHDGESVGRLEVEVRPGAKDREAELLAEVERLRARVRDLEEQLRRR